MESIIRGSMKLTEHFRNFISGKTASGPEQNISESEARRFLCWTMAAWAVIWFIAPLVMIGGIYFDIAENIEWGKHWQFGYDKHPFLTAWVTRAAYDITGGAWSAYLLSQLSIAASVFCIWTLAKHLMTPARALMAALVFYTFFISFPTYCIEFNNDTLQLSIWALTTLFFFLAVKNQSVRYWILAGIFAGLSMMTKYYSVAVLIPMAALVLMTQDGRRSLRHIGIYLGGIAALAVVAPNLIWLVNNDFMPFKYAMDGAGLSAGHQETARFLKYLTNIFELFRMTIGKLIIPIVIVAALFFHRRREAVTKTNSFDHVFIWVMALGPFVISLLFVMFSGGSVKTSWLGPCFVMTGILLFTLWKPIVSKLRVSLFLGVLAIIIIIMLATMAQKDLYKKGYRKNGCCYESHNGRAIAAELTKVWREKYGTRLAYVMAPRTEGCTFTLYSQDKTDAFYFANPRICAWINVSDVVSNGGVLIWDIEDHEDGSKLPEWALKFAKENSVAFEQAKPLVTLRAVQPWFRKLIGRDPKPDRTGVAFLPPASKTEKVQDKVAK